MGLLCLSVRLLLALCSLDGQSFQASPPAMLHTVKPCAPFAKNVCWLTQLLAPRQQLLRSCRLAVDQAKYLCRLAREDVFTSAYPLACNGRQSSPLGVVSSSITHSTSPTAINDPNWVAQVNLEALLAMHGRYPCGQLLSRQRNRSGSAHWAHEILGTLMNFHRRAA